MPTKFDYYCRIAGGPLLMCAHVVFGIILVGVLFMPLWPSTVAFIWFCIFCSWASTATMFSNGISTENYCARRMIFSPLEEVVVPLVWPIVSITCLSGLMVRAVVKTLRLSFNKRKRR